MIDRVHEASVFSKVKVRRIDGQHRMPDFNALQDRGCVTALGELWIVIVVIDDVNIDDRRGYECGGATVSSLDRNVVERSALSVQGLARQATGLGVDRKQAVLAAIC